MKLCKDCKHYRRSWLTPFSGEYAKCERAFETRVNPVTGRTMKLRIPDQLMFCDLQRESPFDNRCGEEARFFEPKKFKNSCGRIF